MKKLKKREWTWKRGVKWRDSIWLHTSCSSYDPLFSTIALLFSHTLILSSSNMQSGTYWLLFYFWKQPSPHLYVVLYFHTISALPPTASAPSTCLLSQIQLFTAWSNGSYQPDCLSVCILLSYLLRCCPSVLIDKTLALCLFETIIYPGKVGRVLIFFSSIAHHIHAVIYIHTQGYYNCPLLASEQVHWEFKLLCIISDH